jgi:diguanylate cyclase (GGDEF)-like protein
MEAFRDTIKKLQRFTDKYFVPSRTNFPYPYLISLVTVFVAVVISLHTNFFGHTADLFFLCAVVFAAWYGGLGPSMVALILAVLADDYFFLDPKFAINFKNEDLGLTLVFLFVGLLVSSLVSSLKRSEEKLSNIALHDHLTGLPNRRLFDDRLQHSINIAERNQKKLAVAFIDIDNFKKLNDEHGHKFGDEVLIKTAKTLASLVREEDTVSRWGGDEFLMLFLDIKNTESVHLVMRKIFSEFDNELEIAGVKVKINLSGGTSIFPDCAANRWDLLKCADDALYKAKQAGKNQYQIAGN